jgi:tetratricopeptide (TPR) repeat protein
MAVICALLFAAVHAPTSYESTFVEQTLSSPYCPVPTNEIKSSTSQQAVDVDGISEDIKHTREILPARPESHPHPRHLAAADMSEMLRLHSNQVGDIALMYKVINLEREALERQHPWHPERAISCATFGSLLHTGYQECRDLALLDEAIRLNREALALRPRGHPQRALSCSNLATSLHAHHEQCGDLTLLQEAIQLKREALALRPLGHSERAVSCATLGSSLYTYYEQWDNVALLDEAIELEREALDLQPPGHPARATSCRDLGASLHARYQQCGDLTQLNEAIELEREALALRPPGHPQRADSCGVLSVSLCARYRRCGNVAMLDKAIELGREALALLPPDHPDRALGCANLGSSLQLYYEQYGAHAFLNESIMLSRDALGLRPPDHPQRADSCVTLGNSLHARYQQCGDLELLNEAIELKREALALRPPGHPQRGLSCASLGSTLHARYLQHRNSALLDEVIDLEREALALRPPGHPERAVSCANLGYSLHARYQQCADFDLLAEVVDLEREALSLQPPSHPQRSLSCRNLSYSLLDLFKRTHDSALLDEVLSICRSVLQDGTSSDALHSYTILSEVHLIPDTPHFSLTSALRYLNLSLEGDVDSIHGFIINTSCNLSRLWNFQTMWTVHTTRLLCSMYARLINQLPLAAGFVLDKPSQLQMLMSTRHIGRDACVVAVLAHQPAKAVELLDCAHGLVWTQALHQRNPPMEGAPPELAAELTRHLRAMAAIRMQLDDPSHHHQDALHHYNTRIQALLREIRVMPGLQHFMLGSTYDTLRNAARDHPVVVLVAGRGLAFALLMASAVEDEPQALHLDLTLEYVQWLQSATQKAGLRSGADSPAGDSDAVGLRLGFEKSGPHVYHKPLRVLAEIWHKIVKPVLDHLNIKVSSPLALFHVR